jgi:hypothetical protein
MMQLKMVSKPKKLGLAYCSIEFSIKYLPYIENSGANKFRYFGAFWIFSVEPMPTCPPLSDFL